MKSLLLTVAVLVLLFQALPAGGTERCWNLHGFCRDKCIKDERVFIFCMSGAFYALATGQLLPPAPPGPAFPSVTPPSALATGQLLPPTPPGPCPPLQTPHPQCQISQEGVCKWAHQSLDTGLYGWRHVDARTNEQREDQPTRAGEQKSSKTAERVSTAAFSSCDLPAMKLLFLVLAIFLALEPVISGILTFAYLSFLCPEDRCWMDGTCRLVCKSDEQKIIRCANRKRCCVLSRYLTIKPMTIDRMDPWTVLKFTTQAPRQCSQTLDFEIRTGESPGRQFLFADESGTHRFRGPRTTLLQKRRDTALRLIGFPLSTDGFRWTPAVTESRPGVCRAIGSMERSSAAVLPRL
ncbi:Beta-defensin 122 [Galemys pyrenaicus]|uniref:Beta-defensin n=1 Tax=Galemys pyrenaicus TaxID=202257 RepID=A0A8J6ANC4_GALPY|nr:Beta-defensin 122 [Galemys pyrenaicus]